MKIRTAVIPAAGLGTRFLPVTKSVPKELLPILEKPMLQYVVEEAAEAGIQRVIVVAAPGQQVCLMSEGMISGRGEGARLAGTDGSTNVMKAAPLPRQTVAVL